jgi:hypothetical protein
MTADPAPCDAENRLFTNPWSEQFPEAHQVDPL